MMTIKDCLGYMVHCLWVGHDFHVGQQCLYCGIQKWELKLFDTSYYINLLCVFLHIGFVLFFLFLEKNLLNGFILGLNVFSMLLNLIAFLSEHRRSIR